MRWLMCLLGWHDVDIRGYNHSGDMIEWKVHTCRRPGCKFYETH